MKLKELIAESGIEQQKIAEQVGVDASMMSRFVNYKCLPTPATMINLLLALDCDVEDIYKDSEIRYPKKRRVSGEGDEYKLCVRLPIKAKYEIKRALEILEYKDVTQWVRDCYQDLVETAKKKESDTILQDKHRFPQSKRKGK